MSGELVVLLTDAQLDALAERVAARLSNGNGHAPPEDTLLTVEQAAKRMAVKSRWIYAHAAELKFVVRLPGSRALRCSERGLDTWLAKRQG